MGTWLCWNCFNVKESQVTHRVLHILDSVILFLVIQVLVVLACWIQIQQCAWEQGRSVCNRRSSTICSAQSNDTGSNLPDSSTIAFSLGSNEPCNHTSSDWWWVQITKWKIPLNAALPQLGYHTLPKICIILGKSFHISNITLSAEIWQWRKLCLGWFRHIMLKGLHLQWLFI